MHAMHKYSQATIHSLVMNCGIRGMCHKTDLGLLLTDYFGDCCSDCTLSWQGVAHVHVGSMHRNGATQYNKDEWLHFKHSEFGWYITVTGQSCLSSDFYLLLIFRNDLLNIFILNRQWFDGISTFLLIVKERLMLLSICLLQSSGPWRFGLDLCVGIRQWRER